MDAFLSTFHLKQIIIKRKLKSSHIFRYVFKPITFRPDRHCPAFVPDFAPKRRSTTESVVTCLHVILLFFKFTPTQHNTVQALLAYKYLFLQLWP